MKRLGLIFLLLLSAFVLSANLFAQSSGGMPPGHQMLADPEKFADGHVAAMDRQVHLSDEQKAKLRPVFLEEGQKLFAVLNSTTMSGEQKQAEVEKLHLETAAKVSSLLTPEQQKQWAPASPPRRSSQATSQT
jgi:Spy/CpxP family protein refolding chaperone